MSKQVSELQGALAPHTVLWQAAADWKLALLQWNSQPLQQLEVAEVAEQAAGVAASLEDAVRQVVAAAGSASP